MFDIGLGEILVLVVAALFVFGPDRLPGVAAQAVRTLRQLREMASSARADLDEAMGPELRDLASSADLNALRDLNPKTALSRLVLDADAGPAKPAPTNGSATNGSATNGSPTTSPSFDPDAT